MQLKDIFSLIDLKAIHSDPDQYPVKDLLMGDFFLSL